MAAPRIIPEQLTHEKAFALRYDWLVNVAALITRGDRALAQDLVQDAYVQFVCARRDLSTIQNLEGYFHGMLRNLYLSHGRPLLILRCPNRFDDMTPQGGELDN